MVESRSSILEVLSGIEGKLLTNWQQVDNISLPRKS